LALLSFSLANSYSHFCTVCCHHTQCLCSLRPQPTNPDGVMFQKNSAFKYFFCLKYRIRKWCCGGYCQIVVATAKLWWLLSNCGGYCQVVVATVKLWWLLSNCGGYCQVVVATVKLWWLLPSCGGYCQVVVATVKLWWLLPSCGGYCQVHTLIHLPASPVYQTVRCNSQEAAIASSSAHLRSRFISKRTCLIFRQPAYLNVNTDQCRSGLTSIT
jgi:hypothetical protein